MLALKADSKISLVPNIALHGDIKNDFFVALNVITGDNFRLNSTSFWIMKLILEDIEWSKLEELFFQMFEVNREEGEKDLNCLVSLLMELNLITVKGGEKRDEKGEKKLRKAGSRKS